MNIHFKFKHFLVEIETMIILKHIELFALLILIHFKHCALLLDAKYLNTIKRYFEDYLMCLRICSVVACAGRRELECFDSEWEVMVIWVIDKEPVVD